MRGLVVPVMVGPPTRGNCAAGGDVLGSWAEKLSGRAGKRACEVLRFAFYGRVSTEDWQDCPRPLNMTM
jgi:hypothetical protein